MPDGLDLSRREQLTLRQACDEVGLSGDDATIFEEVSMLGIFNSLTKPQRVGYIRLMCYRLGIKSEFQPFFWMTDKKTGNITLGRRKSCYEMLGQLKDISVSMLKEELPGDGTYGVWARATTPNGRFVDNCGWISLEGKLALDLQNAKMAAFTKASNRAVGALCGLGMLDETEVNGIAVVEGPKRINPPEMASAAAHSPVVMARPQVPLPDATGEPSGLPDPTAGGVPAPIAIPVAKPRTKA